LFQNISFAHVFIVITMNVKILHGQNVPVKEFWTSAN